jgi:hypothetical protein
LLAIRCSGSSGVEKYLEGDMEQIHHVLNVIWAFLHEGFNNATPSKAWS